jgi:hypothetical protein
MTSEWPAMNNPHDEQCLASTLAWDDHLFMIHQMRQRTGVPAPNCHSSKLEVVTMMARR